MIRNNLAEMIDYASRYNIKAALRALNPTKKLTDEIIEKQLRLHSISSDSTVVDIAVLESIDWDEDISIEDEVTPNSVQPPKTSLPIQPKPFKPFIDLTDSDCDTSLPTEGPRHCSPPKRSSPAVSPIPIVDLSDDEEFKFDDSLDWVVSEAVSPTVKPVSARSTSVPNQVYECNNVVTNEFRDNRSHSYDNSNYNDKGYNCDASSFAPASSYTVVTPPKSLSSYKTASPSKTKEQLNRSFHEWDHNHGNDHEFKSSDFPFSDALMRLFRNKFKLKEFRQNQLEAINATLLGYDTFVLMPTGGGKSLCYQLPACISDGMTVVISPLKSLIYDQITKLKSLGIDVAYLSGDVPRNEQCEILQNLRQVPCVYKLFYVTPERVGMSESLNSIFRDMHDNKTLARFVIDEAHCVSQWGHDFRPDYKKLVVLREKFPSIPIMAVTATANPRVRADVCTALKLKNTKWFIQSFDRPNLKFEVRTKNKDSINEISQLILTQFKYESGIVYCLSRGDCETVAAELQSRYINAHEYHAGLADNVRTEIQDKWISGEIQVICATIAFGMGVDKANVRFVFHLCVPKSMEGYYQEAGRAGRDNQLAHCYLYFAHADVMRLRKLMDLERKNHSSSAAQEAYRVHIENLNHMTTYAYNAITCRRIQLMKYLGEETKSSSLCPFGSKARCDNCESQKSYEHKDVTLDAKGVIECVSSLTSGERNSKLWTQNHIYAILKGSENQAIKMANHNSLPHHGLLKHYSKKDLEFLLRTMISGGYLQEKVKKFGHIANVYITLGSNHRKLMQNNSRIRVTIPVASDTGYAVPNSSAGCKRTTGQSNDDGKNKKTRVTSGYL